MPLSMRITNQFSKMGEPFGLNSPDLGELALDNADPVLLLVHYALDLSEATAASPGLLTTRDRPHSGANGLLEEEDLRVVDVGAHPLVKLVLADHQAVKVGGLRRVLPVDQLNLGELVEDHGV